MKYFKEKKKIDFDYILQEPGEDTIWKTSLLREVFNIPHGMRPDQAKKFTNNAEERNKTVSFTE